MWQYRIDQKPCTPSLAGFWLRGGTNTSPEVVFNLVIQGGGAGHVGCVGTGDLGREAPAEAWWLAGGTGRRAVGLGDCRIVFGLSVPS
jgi:hypothetical protein